MGQELGRVADRLRTLDLARLERRDPGGSSIAERAHATAQALADLAADASGRPRRPVPALAPHAVADQVVVTARDVLAEGGEDARRRALEALVALRRSL